MTRPSSPRSTNMRRANGGLAPLSNPPRSSRRREDECVAVSGEDPAIRSAPHGPRARFGSDLKPRVAAAVAMGSSRAGDGVDRRLYLRRFLVARVGCRPVGMATAGWRRAARRAGRGRRFCGCARCVCSRCTIRSFGAIAALVLGAVAVGWLADGGNGVWAAAGDALRRRARRERRAAEN